MGSQKLSKIVNIRSRQHKIKKERKKEREWGPRNIVRLGYSGAAAESAPDQSLTDITLRKVLLTILSSLADHHWIDPCTRTLAFPHSLISPSLFRTFSATLPCFQRVFWTFPPSVCRPFVPRENDAFRLWCLHHDALFLLSCLTKGK